MSNVLQTWIIPTDIIACWIRKCIAIGCFKSKVRRDLNLILESPPHFVICGLQNRMKVELDCPLLLTVLCSNPRKSVTIAQERTDIALRRRSIFHEYLKCPHIPPVSLPPPPLPLAGKPSRLAALTSTPPSSTVFSPPVFTVVPPAHLGSPAVPTSSSTIPLPRPKWLVSGLVSGVSRKWTGGK